MSAADSIRAREQAKRPPEPEFDYMEPHVPAKKATRADVTTFTAADEARVVAVEPEPESDTEA